MGTSRVENAEKLSSPNETLDFVLCKESYHHFTRPMLALYEMLRVATKAVVLIEPNESPCVDPREPSQTPCQVGASPPLGLVGAFRTETTTGRQLCIQNFRARAGERGTRGGILPPVQGDQRLLRKRVEFEKATRDSALLKRVQEHISTGDRRCRLCLSRYTPSISAP